TVLSYGLWQELGGNPSIVGQQLHLGGQPRTIVGVMPRGFWFPSPAIRMWNAAPFRPDNQNGNWTLVGRVAKGSAVAQMQGPLAGASAAGLAAAGFGVLLRALPLGALAETTSLDWTVLATSIVVAMIASSVIALIPAVALWRGDLQSTIATQRAGGISGRGG